MQEWAFERRFPGCREPSGSMSRVGSATASPPSLLCTSPSAYRVSALSKLQLQGVPMGRWRGRHCAAVAVYLLSVIGAAADAQAQYFGRNKVHYDRLDFRVL